MDSQANTYKHGRVMTAVVYIAVPCLKIRQHAEMEMLLTLDIVCTCFYLQGREKNLHRLL